MPSKLQFMDLGESITVQCFNCHGEIPSKRCPLQPGPTCQECLQLYSSQTTSLQTQNQQLREELSAMENHFAPQLRQYGPPEEERLSQEELQLQLGELQLEELQLRQEDATAIEQLAQLQKQFGEVCKEMDNQSELLYQMQKQTDQLGVQKCDIEWQLGELHRQKQDLGKLSALNELYNIHFDDKAAYINEQPVYHGNCITLLEILCQLMEICHYQGFKVNFCDNQVKAGQNLPLTHDSPQSTLPWLVFMVQEMTLIWEHMQQQASRNPTHEESCYKLPFSISLQPDVSIEGIVLRPGPNYLQFLKCLTHDLKFMMSFAFNLGIEE